MSNNSNSFYFSSSSFCRLSSNSNSRLSRGCSLKHNLKDSSLQNLRGSSNLFNLKGSKRPHRLRGSNLQSSLRYSNSQSSLRDSSSLSNLKGSKQCPSPRSSSKCNLKPRHPTDHRLMLEDFLKAEDQNLGRLVHFSSLQARCKKGKDYIIVLTLNECFSTYMDRTISSNSVSFRVVSPTSPPEHQHEHRHQETILHHSLFDLHCLHSNPLQLLHQLCQLSDSYQQHLLFKHL